MSALQVKAYIELRVRGQRVWKYCSLMFFAKRYGEYPNRCSNHACDGSHCRHCRMARVGTLEVNRDSAVAKATASGEIRCPLWVRSRHSRRFAQYPLYPQKQTLPNGLVVLTAGKRSDLFPAEFLYAGVGLRPVALALLDSGVHVDAGLKLNLFRPAAPRTIPTLWEFLESGRGDIDV